MSKSENKSNSKPENIPVQGIDSFLGLFVRLFWVLYGNIILVFLASRIPQKQTFLSIYDLLYWVIVVLLAISRYCDIKYFKGITVMGSPATLVHWRRYAKHLLLVSAGLWVLANGLSF
jgi:hypothetical protein